MRGTNKPEIKKPVMIFFDFGGTLMSQEFDSRRGTAAVMERAVKIPEGVTVRQVQDMAEELSRELWLCPVCGDSGIVEIRNTSFEKFLYEYFGIEFDIPPDEIEEIFVKNADISKPTPNIARLLDTLRETGVRTAVISNISFSGRLLDRWVQEIVPGNSFEFILATSEYVFKKPSPRIFELALRKAGVKAADAWYCGNHSRFDIDGARGAGLFPVWYKGDQWEDKDYRPGYDFLEIYDWEELIQLVKRR